jgi:hypothetical protein
MRYFCLLVLFLPSRLSYVLELIEVLIKCNCSFHTRSYILTIQTPSWSTVRAIFIHFLKSSLLLRPPHRLLEKSFVSTNCNNVALSWVWFPKSISVCFLNFKLLPLFKGTWSDLKIGLYSTIPLLRPAVVSIQKYDCFFHRLLRGAVMVRLSFIHSYSNFEFQIFLHCLCGIRSLLNICRIFFSVYLVWIGMIRFLLMQ